MYHAESLQEDFLVLSGECVLLIEGEERRLRAWDFVHCPGGTEHIFIGAGEAPCVIFMTGARREGKTITSIHARTSRSRTARASRRRRARRREAYDPLPRWRLGRPKTWSAAALGVELGARQTCTNLRAGV